MRAARVTLTPGGPGFEPLALARRYLLTAVIGTESEQPRRYRLRVYDADLAKRAAGSGGRLVSASR